MKMGGWKRSAPETLRIGPSGLPVLDNFDYEQTSTRQTDTNVAAPISSRANARAVLTVVAGSDAGRLLAITKEETTIGRATTCDLVLPDAGVSRTHARLIATGDGFVIEDLGSKNGTFIDVESVSRRPVSYGDAIQIGPNALIRLSLMTIAEERLSRELYDSSMRDALTKTYNRRYFFDRLHTEIAFAARHHTELSVVVCDFDHFKRVNDTFGHKGGDAVLKQGVQRMLATLRAEDILARVGGEELGVLLRGIGHDDALACAERLRRAVTERPMLVGTDALTATISLGLASIRECASTPTAESIFDLADQRLYAAKREGRNRVVGKR
jgi:two-component system, cell cycle response regulator